MGQQKAIQCAVFTVCLLKIVHMSWTGQSFGLPKFSSGDNNDFTPLKKAINSKYKLTSERRNAYRYHRPTPRNQSTSLPPQCGDAPDFIKFFGQGKRNHSSSGEDRSMYNFFFKNHTDKLQYVELGAFNGWEESNSRFFDECLGWDGVLIEANPKVFSELVRKRPHAHRLSYAASCSLEEEAQNKTVGFWGSAFTNAAEDASINRDAYASGPQSRLVQVPCGSLTPTLVDLIPNGHVHFFSLDVEGMEPKVLETIDFSHVFVDIFLIEITNQYCKAECASRDRTRAIMNEKGYFQYSGKVPRSDIFVHERSIFLPMMKFEPTVRPAGSATQ